MKLDHASLTVLLLVFAAAAAAVWVAGVHLSNATDVLAHRFGMGEALGGLILLAIVTNLPELAITVSAAMSGELGIAIGNVLGGIAIQTAVLALLDVFGLGKKDGLTYRAASLVLVLEGVLVIAVLTLTIIGHELPATLIFARMTPAGVAIAVVWVAGLFLINRARTDLPWHSGGDAPGGQAKPRGHSVKQTSELAKNSSTAWHVMVFAVGALVTLVAGVALEVSGEAIAKRTGMSGVLFGATVLAAATALPEVSTGLASVKLGDYKMAFSDIFGGNAFLPVLFLLATLVSGEAVLPKAHPTDIYLTALGMLLTCVYIGGLVFRPRRQVARMGVDSLLVLVLYAVGIAGLFAIGKGA
ncbi:MAG: sodium:calcium antiporter [Verrucomicrobiota bacterium]|nr:sodium:calcium antiporter [Verrucomicrobiota bacterium]